MAFSLSRRKKHPVILIWTLETVCKVVKTIRYLSNIFGEGHPSGIRICRNKFNAAVLLSTTCYRPLSLVSVWSLAVAGTTKE